MLRISLAVVALAVLGGCRCGPSGLAGGCNSSIECSGGLVCEPYLIKVLEPDNGSCRIPCDAGCPASCYCSGLLNPAHTCSPMILSDGGLVPDAGC